jgi:hypothetical protein
MLSAPVGALIANASVPNSENNLSTTAGAAVALNPAQGIGYILDNIGVQITRYDMPRTYFDAVASVLQSLNYIIPTILHF